MTDRSSFKSYIPELTAEANVCILLFYLLNTGRQHGLNMFKYKSNESQKRFYPY